MRGNLLPGASLVSRAPSKARQRGEHTLILSTGRCAYAHDSMTSTVASAACAPGSQQEALCAGRGMGSWRTCCWSAAI